MREIWSIDEPTPDQKTPPRNDYSEEYKKYCKQFEQLYCELPPAPERKSEGKIITKDIEETEPKVILTTANEVGREAIKEELKKRDDFWASLGVVLGGNRNE